VYEICIVWEDYRNGNYDIYAQRVTESGTYCWASNGVAVCSESGDQKRPKLCKDYLYGTIIVWEDSRDGDMDIYAQRLDLTGNRMWGGSGLSICTASEDQQRPEICLDGTGKAIITWMDRRTLLHNDIYAQKIDYNGNIFWESNGKGICTKYYNQEFPRICSNGSYGVLITWVDKRSDVGRWDIFAATVNEFLDSTENEEPPQVDYSLLEATAILYMRESQKFLGIGLETWLMISGNGNFYLGIAVGTVGSLYHIKRTEKNKKIKKNKKLAKTKSDSLLKTKKKTELPKSSNTKKSVENFRN